jgi:membrane-associated phospholipid phosphatase
MSSISGVAKSAPAPAGHGLAADPIRLQGLAGRWLMFGDYGPLAQRHMATVWACVFACALADALWLPNSKLSFAASNWAGLLQGLVCCALAAAFITTASWRLRNDPSRAAIVIRKTLVVAELLWRAALPIGALLTAGVTLSYLITSADLPLGDDLLASVDRALGFDWPAFLQATNSSTLVAALLTFVYQTTGPVVLLVILWQALHRRGERLAEFIAVLALSTVMLCAVMPLLPAAGAFAFYRPAPDQFGNYAAFGQMWSFAHTFEMLRTGALAVIDLSALQGIVSFPSFHTMLGVMAIYGARDSRWLFIPVLLLNGAMFVSTLTVGGHHLADVLAGAALTLAAIIVVRRRTGVRRAG